MYTSHQRAGDFIAAFERLWRQLSGERPVSEEFAIGEALRMPAGRFYVCRNHAYKMLLLRRHGHLPPGEKPHRRAMWDEMERALAERCRVAPRETEWEALDWIIANYRPSSFFIAPSYARRLCLAWLREEKAEADRRARLAHMRRLAIARPSHRRRSAQSKSK